MKISKDQVRHVAKLARLSLDENEVEVFSKQLSAVFEYMDCLNEVDTDNVEPTSQVTGLKNVYREDEVKTSVDPAALLACTELPIENDQIKVKSVM
ncbi:Asp-tRNA(Asn)/Glu-tRNA(Gln) amidotransferase subunit GatC [Candidatus Peregrinibacteria bacterium]|jgi:aspartyl-tRNA(Asn)/glutamyl-tRNA(Gln) amidotransferase subunit C|nr:Asp-tRNA(Asn)/Glu-tRNA(Gln) amidotransferase subunit GatC [Candidatus Peregrinibacteria bacterium]MBT7484417.1 Asp-tRNA(Asn)/Glu-tRNA(Gln) amidotransferase subunit GatC [Candidatus Peregrinibacteria bacterium]MBT7703585.1 Asp-tRNA(Asn)/Glu-tRNA(Gln) amidotransferase subunit GatC [Candidatus Peregrinibacteria bacterium]